MFVCCGLVICLFCVLVEYVNKCVCCVFGEVKRKGDNASEDMERNRQVNQWYGRL